MSPKNKNLAHLTLPLLKHLPMQRGSQPCNISPVYAPTCSEVPAVTMERVREGALQASGERASRKRKYTNAARDASRALRRLGIGWKIPLRSHPFQSAYGNEPMEAAYLHPVDLLTYLLEKAPEVLWGGFDDQLQGVRAVESFWQCYKNTHATHAVFQHHNARLGSVLPLILHGDEGKGKRRANVACVSLESPLGLHTVLNKKRKKGVGMCRLCCPRAPSLPNNRFTFEDEGELPPSSVATNMKGHSFLQHWPTWLAPATMGKDYDIVLSELMNVTVDALASLFHQGIPARGTRFFFAVVGQKGDLKWHGKIGRLVRGYEHKGRVRDIAMCHQCMAGSNSNLSYEDVSPCPAWSQTRWESRPWAADKPSCLSRIPYDSNTPERIMANDPFHTAKVGIYRDFTGSCVLWLAAEGYFGAGDIPLKLETAHGSFKLWACANSKTPSLRSFSKMFFNYKSSRSYPWTNSKGSDTMLMLRWLRTVTCGFQAELQHVNHRSMLQTMQATADAAVKFFEVQNSHGIWLQHHCASVAREHAASFLNGYAWLAHRCLASGFCGFAMKPKVHFFKHIELDLKESIDRNHKYICNPMIFGCEQNEDLIGRCCKLSRDLTSRYMQQRVLQCFLLKADVLLRRFRQSAKTG